MEHIIQFGVTIDDDAIKKRIEESAKKQITDDISKDIKKTIINSYGWGTDGLTEYGEKLVKSVMEQYKDEIIAGAVKSVADSIKRSKKYKEVLAQIANDMLEASNE